MNQVWSITLKGAQTFQFDRVLTLGETFELKRLAGLTMAEYDAGWFSQEPATWRFVYYLMHKREDLDPGPYGSIDFSWADLVIEPVTDEAEPAEPIDPDLPTGPVKDSEPTTGEQTQSE